jgi:hypothetical protein
MPVKLTDRVLIPVSLKDRFVDQVELSDTRQKTGPQNYRDLILSRNPVGYWRLGEQQGAVAYDETGHGHNGDIISGVSLNTPSLIFGDTNAAVALDGLTGYVDVSDAGDSFDLLTQVSVEAWIKLTGSAGTFRGIINKAAIGLGNALGGYDLGINLNGTARLTLRGTSVLDVGPYAGTSLYDGAVHHIVGTGNVTTLIIYVDSQVVQSATGTWTGVANSQHLTLGARTGDMLRDLFLGLLDELAVYSYVLSPTQIRENYTMGTKGVIGTGPADVTMKDIKVPPKV